MQSIVVFTQMFADLQVKLCDFGLARTKLHTSITWAGLGAAGGTVPYIAPEVLVGVPGKGKMKPQTYADIWAMCLVLIEWYTGKHPLMYNLDEEEDMRKQVKKQIKEKHNSQQPPEELSNMTANAREVLAAGLSYDYTARPSARDMKGRFSTYHL